VNDLSELSVREFLSALASSAPTPGGGTAAAIAGAMGAALAEMVGRLTLAREKFATVHDAMRSLSEAALRAREDFLVLAREDAEAYDAVVAARRLAKETEGERETRAHAIESAGRLATEVPMRTARTAARLLAALPELVEKGNPNAMSDAGAAAQVVSAADRGHPGRNAEAGRPCPC
jgi:formiminotetrahydrofolate cyclodeaminase